MGIERVELLQMLAEDVKKRRRARLENEGRIKLAIEEMATEDFWRLRKCLQGIGVSVSDVLSEIVDEGSTQNMDEIRFAAFEKASLKAMASVAISLKLHAVYAENDVERLFSSGLFSAGGMFECLQTLLQEHAASQEQLAAAAIEVRKYAMAYQKWASMDAKFRELSGLQSGRESYPQAGNGQVPQETTVANIEFARLKASEYASRMKRERALLKKAVSQASQNSLLKADGAPSTLRDFDHGSILSLLEKVLSAEGRVQQLRERVAEYANLPVDLDEARKEVLHAKKVLAKLTDTFNEKANSVTMNFFTGSDLPL